MVKKPSLHNKMNKYVKRSTYVENEIPFIGGNTLSVRFVENNGASDGINKQPNPSIARSVSTNDGAWERRWSRGVIMDTSAFTLKIAT